MSPRMHAGSQTSASMSIMRNLSCLRSTRRVSSSIKSKLIKREKLGDLQARQISPVDMLAAWLRHFFFLPMHTQNTNT